MQIIVSIRPHECRDSLHGLKMIEERREVAALADEDDDADDEALTICLQLYVCMFIFFCVREILYEIDRHLIFVSG